jgi:beta-galactosidase
MRTNWWQHFSVLLLAVLAGCNVTQAQAPSQHTFAVKGRQFLMDGQPYQIISGEMHYPRIPREYWHDRLKKARAMGLNTITTYVFWNLHEPKPGEYDFSGQLDVAAYIRAAQQEGLNVILRPGPYVCAEWDLGGFPAWLLADAKMVLRDDNPQFMKPVERWLNRLGKELAPLQITHGGPIIAVQVENEYGSFGNDHQYMKRIQEMLIGAGLGEALMYTADGPEQLKDGTLPGVQAVVNFGPGEAHHAFDMLAKFRPDQPMMAGEYWDGWFDSWGEKHHATDAGPQQADLEWMLSQGYSVSLYMFHGGTTFGFMNGANYDKGYKPETTSYDYDSPLDEAGRPTNKYMAFREIIARHQPNTVLPEVPPSPPTMSFPQVDFHESASLWQSLGKPIESDVIRPMEEVGQSYGYILYRKQISGAVGGDLQIDGLHDYAEVFINRKYVGSLDRRLGQNSIKIESNVPKTTLEILVENTGRINFGKYLREERKGITNKVVLNRKALTGWQLYPLQMTDLDTIAFKQDIQDGPAFYRAIFEIDKAGDTFLDMGNVGKGVAWINGHALGRFWNIGPQQTLYVPGPWLRSGKNEVVIFDLWPHVHPSVKGLSEPILDELRPASIH